MADALEAGDEAAELGQLLLRGEPELLQQIGVLFGVALIRQLLLGLVDLVALALI